MVAPAERGLGVGGVAAEVEDGLLEGAVRVGEEEEAVEEAIGGGGAGSKHGAGRAARRLGVGYHTILWGTLTLG